MLLLKLMINQTFVLTIPTQTVCRKLFKYLGFEWFTTDGIVIDVNGNEVDIDNLEDDNVIDDRAWNWKFGRWKLVVIMINKELIAMNC